MNEGDSKKFLYEVMEKYKGIDRINELLQQVHKLYQQNISHLNVQLLFKVTSKVEFSIIEDMQKGSQHNRQISGIKMKESFLFGFQYVSAIYIAQNHLKLYKLKKIQEEDTWDRLGKLFYNKTKEFVRFQGLNIMKQVRKYPWKTQDDTLLKNLVKQHGINKWNQLSKIIFFQDGKFITPKQCRERWFNHADSELNRGQWTLTEDYKIIKYSLTYGKKWSKMIRFLNTKRTQHMIKNRYHSIYNKAKKQGQKGENQILLEILEQFELKMNERNEEPPNINQEQNEQNQKSEEEVISEEQQQDINKLNLSQIINEGQDRQRYIDFSQGSKGNPFAQSIISPHLMFMPAFNPPNEDSSKLLESEQYVKSGIEGFNKSQELFSQDKKNKIEEAFFSSTEFGHKSIDIWQQIKQNETTFSLKNSLEFFKVPPSQFSQQYQKLMNGETQKEAKN